MKYSYRKIALAAVAVLAAGCMSAESLVLVHTNDTHSQIDPTDKGFGGIARRKVLIDSIRSVHPNVLLIDAGDAVQGTLFFTLYGGEVEMKMMNELGYDLAVLGNHDFDNGMDALHQLRPFGHRYTAVFQAVCNQRIRREKSGVHRP